MSRVGYDGLVFSSLRFRRQSGKIKTALDARLNGVGSYDCETTSRFVSF